MAGNHETIVQLKSAFFLLVFQTVEIRLGSSFSIFSIIQTATTLETFATFIEGKFFFLINYLISSCNEVPVDDSIFKLLSVCRERLVSWLRLAGTAIKF